MIGDANPHDVNYPDNTLKLDWKEEVEKLAVMVCKVQAICLPLIVKFHNIINMYFMA